MRSVTPSRIFMMRPKRLPALIELPARRIFFLYDGERKLVYRGQLDDARPENGKPVTGSDLRAAMDALLEGRPIADDQKPSMGCNIKWTPGNEPDYS